MTFEHLKEKNTTRCNEHFHDVEDWEPWEWSNAMAGETGETCNLTKKLLRLSKPMKMQINKLEDQSAEVLIDKIMDEIADVVIYADLLSTRLGFSLGEAIRSKFNKTSRDIEFMNNLPPMTLQRL